MDSALIQPMNASELKFSRRGRTKGFTLVELLVVMAIIGILAVISLANFRTSQIKARDAERKNDLRQIANALEAYMSDHGSYPAAVSGRIKACSTVTNCSVLADCQWGDTPREFCDSNNTVYMKEIPDDVIASPPDQPHYCYSSDGIYFQLYARLENENDPEAIGHSYSCAGVGTYNLGIASGNAIP